VADGNFTGWEKVASNMNAFGERTRNNARILMETTVGRTVNEAKRTAPWTDRTGHARRSIHGQVTVRPDAIIGAVGMGDDPEDYPKYLELSHGGVYRTIDPSVFGFGAAELRKDLGDL
jgi:hypothetical protein